ncbi:MAG TPA: alkaline phosphatase family protein [Thermoplasmata archaeon]|nr:alkaline phosphatase family protein [Thermoplasmata archaeon]
MVVLGIVLLLTVSSFGLAPASAPAKTPSKIAEFRSHIQHIIFLLQENHAYDSLFGEYCLATGKYCRSVGDGIPSGTCVPLFPARPTLGCVAPFNFTPAQLTPKDMAHDWNSTHRAWNNGSMNGFYVAEGRNNNTFGHYNGTTAPVYWDLAEEYGLADDFFSPAASYSLPNHWYAVSGDAPNASYLIKTLVAPTGQLHSYLNQSNATPALEDELLNSSVSWDYFDYALPSYATAIRAVPPGDAYDYWNPLAARQQSYTTADVSHFQNRSVLFGDLANGTLPSLSWVIPDAFNSDHPPENLSSGQDWVASLVDALEKSPEWNSTVLFVSWDEYGGFYDGVAPPRLDAYGDGFRVPMLAIGPWVRQGFIDHRTMNFDSILHLMEKAFHLPCISARDCNATLPLAMFNFQHGPRAPLQILPIGQAVYPMPLQTSGKLPYYGPGVGAPIYWKDPGATALPGAVDWS